MEQLVLFLVKSLASKPEEIQIKKEEDDKKITYYISCNSNDLGKIIGKNGRIITSIRTIVKSASDRGSKKIFLKVGA